MNDSLHLSASFFIEIGLFKKVRFSGDKRNVYMLCPVCNKDEFGISLRPGHKFGCFRSKKCGFKGDINKLLSYLSLTKYQIKPYIIKKESGHEVHIPVLFKENEKKVEPIKLPLWYQDNRTHRFKDMMECREYIESRVPKRQKIAFTVEWGHSVAYDTYIIFPIRIEMDN